MRENKITGPDGAVWHRMGDTGYFDSQGRFWLAGRVHSTIRRSGRMVHPQLVEQAAQGGDPRIRRVAALGVPDAKEGERVLVIVEADGGAELRQDVENRLTAAGQPFDEIRITPGPLPVDPRHNSKIDYRRLRDEVV